MPFAVYFDKQVKIKLTVDRRTVTVVMSFVTLVAHSVPSSAEGKENILWYLRMYKLVILFLDFPSIISFLRTCL